MAGLKGLLIFNFLALGTAYVGVKTFTNLYDAKGLVKGICYTIEEDSSSAIVDNDIVYEGSIIHGVKIHKIERDCVVFQKDDLFWTQHVLEKPSTNWLEKDI